MESTYDPPWGKKYRQQSKTQFFLSLALFVGFTAFLIYMDVTEEKAEATPGENLSLILLGAGMVVSSLSVVFLLLFDKDMTKKTPLWMMIVSSSFLFLGLTLWVLSPVAMLCEGGTWVEGIKILGFTFPVWLLATITWGTFLLALWGSPGKLGVTIS